MWLSIYYSIQFSISFEYCVLGCAKKIDFNPLKTHNIQLPDKAMFIVAHSLTTKDKAASTDFNTRVIECRLATQVINLCILTYIYKLIVEGVKTFLYQVGSN